MRSLSRLTAVLLLFLIFSRPLFAQNDTVSQARELMGREDYAGAARLLSSSIASQPSADAYLYLGISYAHIREWMRSELTLQEGATRYPDDPRFHNELAGVYLAANDIDKARDSLKRALSIDPQNKYAADLLATVDMSVGDVKGALEAWNRDGRPVIGEILHNGRIEFENWTIRKASAFRTGDVLTWGKWKTTEARLENAWIYANQGIQIEPTISPDRYRAIIRTVPKTTTVQQFAFTAFMEAVFFKAVQLRLWNIGKSTVSTRTGYRFATNRLRGEMGMMAPLPLPGLPSFEATGFYRSERWNIAPSEKDTGFDPRFYFKAVGIRGELRHIPHYRIDLRLGYEYRNRTASGAQPGLQLNNLNTGKLILKTGFLLFDGRHRSRIFAEGFLAREVFLSDIPFSGGTVEWDTRYLPEKDGKSTIEIVLKTGTTRGALPVDEYFVLGLRPPTPTDVVLRGHNAISQTGHFGNAPMGTSFTLVNTTFDRRIRRLPLFNVLNEPYVDLKWLIFVDGARSFDRAGVFQAGEILVDVGGGFRFETPTRTFNITYGRSLRDGTRVLSAYLSRRW